MLAIALNALKHATHFVRGGAVDMIKDELGITENGLSGVRSSWLMLARNCDLC